MKMLDYVEIIPRVMRANLERRSALTQPLVDAFFFGDYKSMTIIASGSSYNAACVVQEYLAQRLNVPVSIITPEQYQLRGLTLRASPFVIVISQSGASTNIINALAKMQTDGLFRMVLTGDVNSEVGNNCDILIDYGVGEETVRFVTVGFSTLVFYLALFANRIAECYAQQQVMYDPADQFEQLIDQIELQIRKSEQFVEANKVTLAGLGPAFICGNDMNLGVAREAALKFQETLKIAAMHYEVEEFLHGPDIQLSPGYSIFLIDDPEPKSRIKSVDSALALATDKHFLISSAVKTTHTSLNVEQSSISDLSGLINIVPFQVISAMMMETIASFDALPLTQLFREQIPIKKYN